MQQNLLTMALSIIHLQEQFIQHQKAKFFGDRNMTDKILSAKTPLECKSLSMDITNYDHVKWNNEAKNHCEEGIKAKFIQNEDLRAYLLSTGSKRLVECCGDKLWRNGVPLHQEDCLKRSNWNSQGILGEILENVRSCIGDILGMNNDIREGSAMIMETATVGGST